MNELLGLTKLNEPFPADEIEWRVQSTGEYDGRLWCSVLAYVSNRAIMNRLDSAVGSENWQNVFKVETGGMVCGIGIRIGNEWVWKYDGAQETEFEPFKGGLSGSMKRAAVQWGIGRYLYYLEASYPEISLTKMDGYRKEWYKPKGGGEGKRYFWKVPTLPAWALPKSIKEEKTREPVTEFEKAVASMVVPPVPASPVLSREEYGACDLTACDLTVADMESAEKMAQAIGLTPGQFKMGFILHTQKTTASGQIAFKKITRKQYQEICAAMESKETFNRFLNDPSSIKKEKPLPKENEFKDSEGLF